VRKTLKIEPRLIGYARVSTIEQNLDMQEKALLAAGVKPQHLHVEKVSASSKLRPKLEWALTVLRPGDTLIVWKLDRFARSMQDLLKGLKIIERSGAGFRSITEHIDTTTPAGMLMVHVLGALAQFERDLVVQRTRHGVAAAQARGVQFGQPKKLNAKQVAQCKRWRREKHTYRKIVDLCKSEFDIKVSAQTVMKSVKRKPKKD
jgi:DNA invertase Pin-like site-specific DNA recombinase